MSYVMSLPLPVPRDVFHPARTVAVAAGDSSPIACDIYGT